MRKKGFLAAVMLMTAAGLLMRPAAAFGEEAKADLQDTDQGKVRMTVAVGEHGSVNGQTQSFVQEMNTGASCALSLEADEGYVTGEVLVNEEPLAAEEAKQQKGSSETKLFLEKVLENAEISVTFEKADPAGTVQKAQSAAEAQMVSEEAAAAAETPAGTAAESADAVQNSAADNAAPAGDSKTIAAEDTGSADAAQNAAADTSVQTAAKDAAEKTYDRSPKTGDGFMAGTSAALLISCAAGAGVLLRKRRRRW